MARRTAEEAREAILAITERHLAEHGPDAVKLDEVAAELGVSRQAVLHHFGSRAALMRAVVERAWAGLFRDLAVLVEGESQGTSPEDFVDLVDEVVRRRGNARLGAWLLLSGRGLPQAWFEGALAELPDAAGRAWGAGDGREARFALIALASALFGDAIFGTRLRQALGEPDGEAERAAFRRWLAARLTR